MFSFLPIVALVCVLGPLPKPPSFLPPVPQSKEHAGHATTEVRIDVGWVGPLQTFHIIVAITPDAGWHTYWKNPGASGTPTEFDVQVPEGFIVGEPLFPRPLIFSGTEGVTYGYTKEAAIFIPITAPSSLQDGTIEIGVTTLWLACKENCVMGEQATTLHVSTNAMMSGPLHKDMQLSRWEEALPKPLDVLAGGAVVVIGSTLYVTGETTQRPIRFIGIEQKGLRFGLSSELIVDGDSFRLPVPMFVDFENAGTDVILIEGLLTLGRKTNDPAFIVRIELDASYSNHKINGN